ncbi:aspartate oxidase [Caldalkalibacillus uzonensis]|uniref:L-aspartate oxidase n=1 Tax=Caldalkalibacillus uzonensis TaxID=353224 RepID=A0ABU0CXQ8_9BACI|nr:FAD-dependent oxidoreductase [Caldalkalibacillus uzonensis]MDQ0340772.1 aspartate oxidase [Caldalkalibacillus uzonensis]
MPQAVTFDVLIVGGGQAALRAAIASCEAGARVGVLAKGKIGYGGSSSISDAVHTALLDHRDSPRQLVEDMLAGGREINHKRLVQVFAEECTARVKELSEVYHIPLEYERELVTPGHSYPRRCYHPKSVGSQITRRLREVAAQKGAVLLDHYTVIDLLEEERVAGVVAIHHNTLTVITAGSVILASGGLGGLYDQTDNPNDVTGEVIAMAWRKGARLRDLEFIQFYPYRLISPQNIDLYTKLFAVGAVMRNAQGERFMEHYPRQELETRDILSYEMFKQGKVYLDITRVEDEDLRQASPKLYQLLKRNGQQELIVSPVEHYSIGGIEIDEWGRTNVPGLFACGECSGGLHGANRLGGGALTEALVFGKRAGECAAWESKPVHHEHAGFRLIEKTDVQWSVQLLRQTVRKVRKEIQPLMWNYVGIERTKEGLEHALSKLTELKAITQCEENTGQRIKQIELDMIHMAYWITKSALERAESRGAHIRRDYPRQNDKWKGYLRVEKNEITFCPCQLDDEEVQAHESSSCE